MSCAGWHTRRANTGWMRISGARLHRAGFSLGGRSGNKQPQGFTLVEVALSIAMGLVIIAAAMMAFNVTKRNAIAAQQQGEAATMRSIVESAIAKGAFPKWTTSSDVDNGLFLVVPKSQTNPYSGVLRVFSKSGIGAYTICTSNSAATVSIMSPLGTPSCAIGSQTKGAPGAVTNVLGGFVYWYDSSTVGSNKYTIWTQDNTSRTFDGWAFVETDMAGNVAAYTGGGIGSSESAG